MDLNNIWLPGIDRYLEEKDIEDIAKGFADDNLLRGEILKKTVSLMHFLDPVPESDALIHLLFGKTEAERLQGKISLFELFRQKAESELNDLGEI